MISSFFDKTKPINYVVLLGAVLLLFLGVTLKHFGLQLSYSLIFERILALGALLVAVFVLGDMAHTKKLTLNNSYSMLFFLLLLLCFPSSLKNTSSVFSSFFVLLSMNRAMALKNEKTHKEKIFESTFWLFLSSLFFEWALIFLVPLYISIYQFSGKQLRLWLMPIAALLCGSILAITAMIMFNGSISFIDHYRFPVSLDFFLNPDYGFLCYAFLVLALIFIVFGKLGYRRLGRTLSLRLVFSYWMVGLIIVITTGDYHNGLGQFSFIPAAIFGANFMETLKQKRIKELIMIFSILLPIVVLILWLWQ